VNATYNKDEQITFDVYKTVIENLWLKAECQGTKKYEGDYLKKDGEYFVIGKKCECEARVRAFMRMLRVKEGTVGEKGYTMLFGKKDFVDDYGKDMSTHPKVVIKSGNYSSSAAGAYQIMQKTYDDAGFKKNKNKYNIASFNQESQDKLCLVILKYNYVDDRPSSFYDPIYWKDKDETIRDSEKENKAKERRKRFKGKNGDIIKMLIDDNYDQAVLLSSLCWASLPDAPYGQPTGTKEECKANYEKFLKEELAGKSDLYLKKGFLKEFDYDCCGEANAKSDGKWHDPVDNPIATIFTQSQSSGEFNDSGKHWGFFGNTRSGSAHAGLDLFAKTGTNIYACVDGTVYNRRWHSNYGNTITIKVKDKEAFLKLKKEYKLQYEDDGEISQGANWSEEGNI
jgi:muramidase (phage lysozyme)